MKNLLYVIAGLIVVIWFIVILSFDTSPYIHLLLALAGVIVLIRLLFSKRLSGNQHY